MEPNSNSDAYRAGCKAMVRHDYSCAALEFDRAILDDPESPAYYNAAAVAACRLGQHRRAEDLYKHAIDTAESTFGHDSALVGNMIFGLVDLYQTQDLYDEAAIQCRDLLDRLQEGTAGALRSRVLLRLAEIHRQRQELDDAEAAYLQAIETLKLVFGKNHERVIEILPDLAALYHEMGRDADSERLSRQAQIHWSHTKSLEAA